jgi:hypothetical protein
MLPKNRLQEYYNLLDKIYDDYADAEWHYKNGSNKKIRDKGLAGARRKLDFLEYLLNKDNELLNILTIGTESDYHKTIILDELLSIQYFSRDMSNILEKLNAMINIATE